MTELKTANRQVRTREQKIEELTGVCNTLQLQSAELIEENCALRDQLGMPPRQQSISDTSSNSTIRGGGGRMSSTAGGLKKPHQQQERALLQVMQREIERLEEERVHLKTENRKLAVQLGHKAARLGLDADDLRAVQEYRDALRERRRNLSLTPKGTS